MIAAFVFAQLGDLATFLIALHQHPELVDAEIGPIGVVWLLGGPVVAAMYKVTLAAIIVWCYYMIARTRAGLALVPLALGIIAGFAGIFANTATLLSVS